MSAGIGSPPPLINLLSVFKKRQLVIKWVQQPAFQLSFYI